VTESLYRMRVTGPARVVDGFASFMRGAGIYLWEPLALQVDISDKLSESIWEIENELISALRDGAAQQIRWRSLHRNLCALDFNQLIPMPLELYYDGNPSRRRDWFREHWGVSYPIRKIDYQHSDQRIRLAASERPRIKRRGAVKRDKYFVRRHLVYYYMADGWAWPVVKKAMKDWPELFIDLGLADVEEPDDDRDW